MLFIQGPAMHTKTNSKSAAALSLGIVLLSAFAGNAHSQQGKRPTIEDMHRLLDNAARQANTQMSNTRLDDFTTLKIMTYDRGVPAMTYHYTSSALQASAAREFNDAAKRAMVDHHKSKTCGTQFVPFMRVFGLRVAHRFEDTISGKELMTITVTGKDCPSN